MREFRLPDVGEGVAEGEIVRWLVSVGDRVEEDQPVAEVETDKALVEVPAPVDGVVREIRAEEGEVVPVGEVIVVFEADADGTESGEPSGAAEPGESSGEREAAPEDGTGTEPASAGAAGDRSDDGTQPADAATGQGRAFAPPRVRRLARELGVDLADVRGSGPGGRITEGDVRAASDEAEAPDPVEVVTGGDAGDSTGAGAEPGTETQVAERERTLAVPATRRVAEELGVDIDRVPAVEERDGEAFVTEEAVREFAGATGESTEGADTTTPGVAEPPETTEVESTPEGEVERVPYRGVRRSIGEQMERSAYTAPHVTHHDAADATRLVEVRESLKPEADERDVKLTYLPFVMKAVVEGLREFPDLNAELDEEAGEIVRKQYYDLGVATATDAGLMVPVVEDVEEKGLLELAAEVNDLTARARDRSIAREEMQGGTFTITNFGAIGGEYATPIINYPEVAILGLGAIEKRPVVVEGEVVARHTLPLSLSIDHRVVDGAVAARFTNAVIAYLEEPARLLL